MVVLNFRFAQFEVNTAPRFQFFEGSFFGVGTRVFDAKHKHALSCCEAAQSNLIIRSAEELRNGLGGARTTVSWLNSKKPQASLS